MTLDAVLSRGRARALQLMTETCTVRRAGTPSTDANTGVVTPTWSTIYSGVCRVQETGAIGGNEPAEVAASDAAYTATMIISMPMSATGMLPGDQVVIGTSQYDTALPGRVMTIIRVQAKGHATARRVWAEDVQA